MRLFLFIAALCFGTTAQSQTTFFYSTDRQVHVTCKFNNELSLIQGIESIESKVPLSGDTTISIGSHRAGDLYLHIHPADTALFVIAQGTRYYLYPTATTLSEEVTLESLKCIYRAVRYPPEARQKGISGTVIVDMYLDEFGRHLNTDVQTNLGYGLEKQALGALGVCSYKPGQFAGMPVKTLYIIPVAFRLR